MVNEPSLELCSLATNGTQESHEGIAYFSFIASSNLLATLICLIKMAQFHIKDSGLEFIDTRVAAQIVVDIFLMTAIIAQSHHDSSQFVIVSGHSTSIAESAKVLAWIETVTSSIAKGTSLVVAKSTSMSLGIIFDEFQMMMPADVPNQGSIGATTIEMDNHDSACAWGDGTLYLCIVNLKRIEGRLHENGFQPTLSNSEDRGDVGIGRHDDLIPRLHHAHLDISAKNKGQGIETITATYAETGTDIIGIVLLKAARGLSFQIPSAVEYATDSLTNLCIIQVIDSLQVKILNHRSYSYVS